MGLDVYLVKGEGRDAPVVELDSVKYPEHLFKIGYFRSSYNRGGINTVLNDRIGLDLYKLFGNEGEYRFKPDWVEAKRRTEEALEKFRLTNKEQPYTATVVGSSRLAAPVKSEAEAVKLFVAEKNRVDVPYNYSNRDGRFWTHQPLEILAAINGTDLFRDPCVYLVYKDEDMSWYEQALEIVIETCDYVLAQPDADNYTMDWSG